MVLLIIKIISVVKLYVVNLEVYKDQIKHNFFNVKINKQADIVFKHLLT